MDCQSVITSLVILSAIPYVLSQIPGFGPSMPGNAMRQEDPFSSINYWVQINSVMGILSIHKPKSWQELYNLYHGNRSQDASFMIGTHCNLVNQPCSAVNSACINDICDCTPAHKNFLDIFCLDPKVYKFFEEKSGLDPAKVTRRPPFSATTNPTLNPFLNQITNLSLFNNTGITNPSPQSSNIVTITPVGSVTPMGSLSPNPITFPNPANLQNNGKTVDPFMITAERFTVSPNSFEVSTFKPRTETISIDGMDELSTEPPKIIKIMRGQNGRGVRRRIKNRVQEGSFPVEQE